MSRFNTDAFRSLNESIAKVQNPQAALNEALDYTAALEEILLALCEELDLDPNELIEDIQTPERAAEMEKTGESLRVKISRAKTRKQLDKADKAHNKQQAQDIKEKRAKTVYGKGGKPVRKGSEQHKAAVKKAAAKKTGTTSRGDERQSSDRRGYSAADAFNAENQRQWDAYYRARADADHREGKYRY